MIKQNITQLVISTKVEIFINESDIDDAFQSINTTVI